MKENKFIQPFIKEEHNAKVVLTKGFGIVNLDELPKRVWEDKDGYWKLGWAHSIEGNVLSVSGGKSTLDFNGEDVCVVRIIKKNTISVVDYLKMTELIKDMKKAPNR